MILAAAAVGIWQRDNISAVISAAKYSDEDIQKQIDDSKKSVEKELESYDVKGLRDFTFEEEEAIRKGQMTVEEAVSKIISESSAKKEESSVSGETKTTGESTLQNDSSSVVSEYSVKLYSLKATYLGQIGNLIDEAKADYKSGTKASALMSKYLGRAASLEKEADSEVESLLSELKAKLNNIGADTSIVETMRSSYENEKSLKKSYYMSLFNKKK